MSSPFFLATDIVQLTPDFVIQPAKRNLLDASLGVRHSISEQALPLLQVLQNGVSIDHFSLLAQQHSVSIDDLRQLLVFLNLCGAIRRTRSIAQILWAWRIQIQDKLHGIAYQPMTRRSPVCFRYILLAAVHACASLFAATLLLDISLLLTNWFDIFDILKLSSLSLAIFVSSIAVHEYAHSLVIRYYGHPSVVVQRGIRLGILHTRLSYGVEVLSAICGPLSGVIFCGALFLATQLIHWYSLAGVILLIMAIHACGLLPWYGDGASLRHAFKVHQEISHEQ